MQSSILTTLLTFLGDNFLIIFFSLFGGAARFCIRPPTDPNIRTYIGSMIVAAFSGFLTFKLLTAYACNVDVTVAGAGLMGFLGDDVLRGILKIGNRLQTEPIETVQDIKNLLSGKEVKHKMTTKEEKSKASAQAENSKVSEKSTDTPDTSVPTKKLVCPEGETVEEHSSDEKPKTNLWDTW